MKAYYVTFKEYNKNPRFIIIEMHSSVAINLNSIKFRLTDYGIKEKNIEFIFGWSKIEN